MKVAVIGSGAIGTFIGGTIAHYCNTRVTFIGRSPNFEQTIKLTNISSSKPINLRSNEHFIYYNEISKESLDGVDVIFVCVAYSGLEQVAKKLSQVLQNNNSIVLSLQNGISSVSILKKYLPKHTILSTVVSFNVVQMKENHYHSGTGGIFYVGGIN